MFYVAMREMKKFASSGTVAGKSWRFKEKLQIPTGAQTMRTSNCLRYDSVLCVFVKCDLCVDGCMGLGVTYEHEERQHTPW